MQVIPRQHGCNRHLGENACATSVAAPGIKPSTCHRNEAALSLRVGTVLADMHDVTADDLL
jgi:hypothetical protein